MAKVGRPPKLIRVEMVRELTAVDIDRLSAFLYCRRHGPKPKFVARNDALLKAFEVALRQGMTTRAFARKWLGRPAADTSLDDKILFNLERRIWRALERIKK